MSSVAKLVSSKDIEVELGHVTDKQIAAVSRLGKLMRKQEATLRETIDELTALGYRPVVMVKETGEVFILSEVELTFRRMK